jgi:parvulin-like peptidyl-prolyl isomerase
MTFRTRSAPPTRRRVRRSDSRRAIYITLSFSLAIMSAVALMGGVFAADYYSNHGAPIASVNGETISKDQVRDRANLNLARYQRQLANYGYQRNRNLITTSEYNTLNSAITTSVDPSALNDEALTQLIEEAELRQYAAKNNITATEAQVDAAIKTDGTIAEMRHVKAIGVETRETPPASAFNSADAITSYTAALDYRVEILGGKKWDDVETAAKTANNDTAGGDVGLVTREGISVDPDFGDAIFALKKVDDLTAVFKGSDGNYRFATVTSIVPEFVDTEWEANIANAAGGDVYRVYARAQALKKAVQGAIEAKYISGPTVQRRVQEIVLSAGYGQPGDGDEVKLRIMVFAPAGNTSVAASLPTTDSTWVEAKTRADEALAKVRADPSQWGVLAADTTVNNDQIFSQVAGEVPWIPADIFNETTESGNGGLTMPNVQEAVFADGLKPGTILDPIQETQFGWVLIQFQGRRQAPEIRVAACQFNVNNGADFAAQAKANSEAADALDGGDLGWVSPYQLTSDQEKIVYSTPVGRASNLVSANGYYYVYRVVEETTRVAEPDQQRKLKLVVFSSWLSEFQANALVWKDTAALTALAPTASATP